MPTNDLIAAQIKQALNPEILLLEVLREKTICRERELEQARETLRLQEERVQRLGTILKSAQELAH